MHYGNQYLTGVHHAKTSELTRAGHLLREQLPNLVVSKRRVRKVEAIQMVRENREREQQNVGFSARPFVLVRPTDETSPGRLSPP